LVLAGYSFLFNLQELITCRYFCIIRSGLSERGALAGSDAVASPEPEL